MFDALPPLEEVVVHVTSYHTDRSVTRNERNYGLGLRFKDPNKSFFYMIGEYRNSEYRNSFYGGIGKELWQFGPLSVRVLVGAITGYRVPVAPIALPELAVTWGGVGMLVNYVPHIGNMPEVFGFSLVKRF